jgi:rubredoxin
MAAASQNPTCPNCGKPMSFIREGVVTISNEDPRIYECEACNLVFMTEDHLAVSGVSPS